MKDVNKYNEKWKSIVEGYPINQHQMVKGGTHNFVKFSLYDSTKYESHSNCSTLNL